MSLKKRSSQLLTKLIERSEKWTDSKDQQEPTPRGSSKIKSSLKKTIMIKLKKLGYEKTNQNKTKL